MTKPQVVAATTRPPTTDQALALVLQPAGRQRLLANIETPEDARVRDGELSALDRYAAARRCTAEQRTALVVARALVQRCGGVLVKAIPRAEGFKGNSKGTGIRHTLRRMDIPLRVAQRWEMLTYLRPAEIEAAGRDGKQLTLKTLYRLGRARMESKAAHATRAPVQLLTGPLRDVGRQVADASVDAIVTDPPYGRDALSAIGDLARFSARVLRPGGSLLCMIGQSYLPEVIATLAVGELRYHWCLAYLTPGGQAVQLWNRSVNTFWKPILWFVRGTYEEQWVSDVVKSAPNDNDKAFHEWGQSETGMADLLRRFTRPGAVICDPFVGGGTTAVVASRLGRSVIGIDSNAEAIATTRKRLAQ